MCAKWSFNQLQIFVQEFYALTSGDQVKAPEHPLSPCPGESSTGLRGLPKLFA